MQILVKITQKYIRFKVWVYAHFEVFSEIDKIKDQYLYQCSIFINGYGLSSILLYLNETFAVEKTNFNLICNIFFRKPIKIKFAIQSIFWE